MLTRLYADNYRCFVNFELRPGPLNLLIGANGSGKSTVFGVLIALQDLIARGRTVVEAFPAANLTLWEHERPIQTFEIDLTGPKGAYRYQLQVEHDRGRGTARVRRESIHCDDIPLYVCEGGRVEVAEETGATSSFPVSIDGSFLAILEPRPEQERLAWFKRFIDEIILLRPDVHLIRGDTLREEERLARDASNFASWYRNFVQEQADAVAELNQELREVLDGFRSLRVEGPAGRRREVYADFSLDGKTVGYSVPMFDLSDGQILLILLYTLAYSLRRSARLVCIDEPDNYVALFEIQPWLVQLRALVEESESQLMIISHHPEVMNGLAPDWVWEFSRPSAGPARVAPFEIDREKGLGAAEWILARGRVR